jgi:glycerol-1-phosphate dehydrogenase [NAD(P)+]
MALSTWETEAIPGLDDVMTGQLDRARIDAALAQASTTRQVVVRSGGLDAVPVVAGEVFPGRPVVVVADGTTWAIAGERVTALLEAAGHPVLEPVLFPGSPTLRPDTRQVSVIRERLESEGEAVLPLAVGSGSINDLTKRAAHEAGLPYISVATAASMDGYTASGAALIHDGVKQTFGCDAPVAVIADLDILCAAPAGMTASGYADLLGKVTAGADWIVADAVGVEPIVPDVWEMVQGPLPSMIANPARFQAGDPESIEQLFLGLVLTGLAIQASGSTRCASGSEHQFSHLWEMRGLEHRGELVSHGNKVGFGSIFSAALYERLLARDWRDLDVEATVSRWPSPAEVDAEIMAMDDSPALIERALEECRAKYIDRETLRQRLERFRDVWPMLEARLRDQLLSTAQIREMLVEGGGPVEPEEIGLTLAQVRESYAPARRIRQRYTVYDLAYELGVFEELVDGVFGPQGYWAPAAVVSRAV